jgi:hypothetical protein
MEALTPRSKGEAQAANFSFAEFFEQVGAGLVEAQRRIDELSLDYLKSVRGQPLLTPSVFRIPRLAAQVKFALERADEKSVGFVFFQDRDSAQSMNQQTVDFEIVAAPPPPGAMAAETTGPVVARELRAGILTALAATGPGGRGRTGALENPDCVVITGFGEGGGFQASYAEDAPGHLAEWFIDAGVVEIIREFGEEDCPSARRRVLEQGVRQADLLRRWN